MVARGLGTVIDGAVICPMRAMMGMIETYRETISKGIAGVTEMTEEKVGTTDVAEMVGEEKVGTVGVTEMKEEKVDTEGVVEMVRERNVNTTG